VPSLKGKFAVIYVPASGLFYNGKEFSAGDGTPISVKPTIPVFDSTVEAERWRKQLIERYPGTTESQFGIIPFEPKKGN